MASSDSAKRAARLASKSGGKSSASKQKNWVFPAAIVAILVLGVGVIAFGRSERAEKDPSVGRGNTEHPIAQLSLESRVFDHWHAAFAINICGQELGPVGDIQQDLLGIHTHRDGLIHVHPFSLQTAGKKATMARFFDQVGIEVSGDRIELPIEYNGGDTFESGVSTCGGEPAEWVLAHWDDAESAADQDKADEIITEDFGKAHFDADLGAYTLAFVPVADAADVPPPSVSREITWRGLCDSANPPAQCAELLGDTTVTPGGTPSTEVTGENDPTATTVAGAPDETTPDTGAEDTTTEDAGK